jgi:RimJ/RimL family protein N-acetyltransferase
MIPTLLTERLVLSSFTLDDLVDVVKLAGAREIADTTIAIPHPYRREHAEYWISGHASAFEAGAGVDFAIRSSGDGALLGAVGLREVDPENSQAELGFWIGVPFWGKGYATEAAAAVVQYAFAELGLNRVYAHHMTRNPASRRVLLKIGMREEGRMRQRVRKWGRFEDVVAYAILRSDPGS